MKLKEISIKNYRNFNEECTIKFNDEINFIIGENNLGKSNFLILMNKIFNSKYLTVFGEEDFSEPTQPITVKLKIEFNNEEDTGVFGDSFSPDSDVNETIINLKIEQSLGDETIFTHLESEKEIRRNEFKKFNLFYINSSENKNNLIDFTRSYKLEGSLNSLLDCCLEKCDPSEVTKELDKVKEFENLKSLLSEINRCFSKLYVAERHGLEVDFKELDQLIPNLFLLKENNGIDFNKSGQGIRSLLYLELAILFKLFKIKKEQNASFSRFDSFFVIDEPEIHLDNYKQRCFIKHLLNTLKYDEQTADNSLKNLFSELFGIERFDRQVFIVTHSSDILGDDYKQIIRFYKRNNELKIISGEDLLIDERKELKHFFQHIKDLKESFFSKGIIICEGDTEVGFLKSFLKRKNIDPDKVGLSIIQAGSNSSIPIIKKICNQFGLNCIAIRDRDELNENQIQQLEEDYIFCTTEKDSEEEFMKFLDKDYFENEIKNHNIFEKQIEQKERGIISEISDDLIMTQMKKNKDVVFKFKCAECLKTIPPVFVKVIDKIVDSINENG